ncbi:1-aminocyclopropane-1-carboxylate oxidase 1 [Papaver somniferum]|nr:1-aminocyclopropane-1-carboxylate oxidase 1 [Papaver somniferum]
MYTENTEHSSVMASSAENPQMAPAPTLCGVTAAPPPTPSAQPNRISTSDAEDALSRLLHRLPPTLSLPSRLAPRTTSPPSVAFSQDDPSFLNPILSSSSAPSQLGFFQLSNHNIPSKLAVAAEKEALSLLNLPSSEKRQLFSDIWPLSFDYNDDGEEDGEDGNGESFCFDTSCTTESTQSLSSLKEFANSLEKVGLETIKALSHAVGFENPLGEEDSAASNRFSSLMWISEGVPGNNPGFSGRFYPYIIALQYQIRCRKYSLLADSGWVSVSPQVDSVLVTIGDVAQVWSNGKLKKVRGRPTAFSESTRCISMSLLLTLPTDSTASDNFLHPAPALVPTAAADTNDSTGEEHNITDCKTNHEDDQDIISRNSEMVGMDNSSTSSSKRITEDKILFCSFNFEDYAWRVYHERLPFKDPLDRYRLSDD